MNSLAQVMSSLPMQQIMTNPMTADLGMELITVEELIVPLEEYATVGKDATLYDAVMALEKAQEKFDYDRYFYLHRAILVLDEDETVAPRLIDQTPGDIAAHRIVHMEPVTGLMQFRHP